MMKAHKTDREIKPYKNYRDDTVTIGDMLDIYEEAKLFMINRISKTHGKDVSNWPKDVQQELRTSFAASDMCRDVMMALYKLRKEEKAVDVMVALYKQRKEEKAASEDEHSPIGEYTEEAAEI